MEPGEHFYREELQGNTIGNQENISIKRRVTKEHYR